MFISIARSVAPGSEFVLNLYPGGEETTLEDRAYWMALFLIVTASAGGLVSVIAALATVLPAFTAVFTSVGLTPLIPVGFVPKDMSTNLHSYGAKWGLVSVVVMLTVIGLLVIIVHKLKLVLARRKIGYISVD